MAITTGITINIRENDIKLEMVKLSTYLNFSPIYVILNRQDPVYYDIIFV